MQILPGQENGNRRVGRDRMRETKGGRFEKKIVSALACAAFALLLDEPRALFNLSSSSDNDDSSSLLVVLFWAIPFPVRLRFA